jgi:hypothetical protein
MSSDDNVQPESIGKVVFGPDSLPLVNSDATYNDFHRSDSVRDIRQI